MKKQNEKKQNPSSVVRKSARYFDTSHGRQRVYTKRANYDKRLSVGRLIFFFIYIFIARFVVIVSRTTTRYYHRLPVRPLRQYNNLYKLFFFFVVDNRTSV